MATRWLTMVLRRRRAGLALLVCLGLLSLRGHATPPPPGASILNQAAVEFYNSSGGPTPDTNAIRMDSPPVRAVVDASESLVLTDDRSVALKPGATAHLPHRLLYTGPSPAWATLTWLNAAGDGFDLLDLRACQDLNTNGMVDAGEPLLAPGSPLSLLPGVPFDLVLAGQLPSQGLEGGQVASVQVTAALATNGLVSTVTDRVTAIADAGALFVELTGSRTEVEIGDFIDFTIRVRNASGIPLDGILLTNDLAAGFAYEKNTATMRGTNAPNPGGGAGPRLVFSIGHMENGEVVTLTCRVRARPGATKGDGVFWAYAASASPQVFVSNRAKFDVDAEDGGVFTDDGVVVGKVFIDANQNRVQDVGELGIPGVRLYLEDGTFVITDSEGKYSLYGLKPQTHVLKLDETTLPEGAELLAPTTRHAGSGGTRFVDINRGELHKANFTVGYATPEFVQAVKRRRLQAERGAHEIETAVKGRLTPDGAPLVTGDPKSLPASGFIGGPPSVGPSLTSGITPAAAHARAPPTTVAYNPAALALTSTNLPAADAALAQVASTNPGALPQATPDAVFPGTNGQFGFVGLKDGDTWPTGQATLRVVGAQGAKVTLKVNGRDVTASRLGRRAVATDQKLEAWEFVGVPLKAGRNELEAVQHDAFGNERGRQTLTVIAPDKPGRIRILTPDSEPLADGRTPAKVIVKITDARGVPVTARLPVTLEANLGQWQEEDLDKREPGTQVFVEGGGGEFHLLPPLEPGESRLRASSGGLKAEGLLIFVPELRPMLAVGVLEGTLNLSDLDARAAFPPRSQDGFEEELQAYGLNSDTGTARAAYRAAFFCKGKVLGRYLLTAGFDSNKEERERLFRDIQPDEFYPVYGDSSVKGFDAQTTGRFYVRVDRNRCYVLYGDLVTASQSEARSLGNYSRSLTGGRLHLENKRYRVNLWASEDSTRQVIEEFRGNGTSGPYQFQNRNGLLNSEKVEIITRDRHQPNLVLKTEGLTRFTDYEFEPFTGRLLLRRPVPSVDESLNPVFIRVTYEVDQDGDKFWVYGADAQVKVTERVEVGGAAIRDENPLGAYGLYSANATVKLAEKTFLLGEYAHSDTDLADGDAGRVELRHQGERLDARLYYGQASDTFSNSAAMITAGRLEAGAKVSYRLGPTTRLVGEAIDSQNLVNDGERVGGTLSVEQSLGGKAKLEVGGRHSTETGAPASGSTAQTPGVTPNEVTSVRAKLTLPVPYVKSAAVYGEIENDVVEPDKRLLAAGGEYQIAPKSRLYARHEFMDAIGSPYELNNFQAQNTTVVGLDTEYMKDGTVFNEYRARDAFAGREAEAAIGLRNLWHLGEGVRLNTTLERVNPVEGGGQNEATAGAFGLEYTRHPEWKGTARLELRTAEANDSLLNTFGYARKLARDWTFLGRTILYCVENKTGSGGDKTQARFQAGVAYRQTETDRWHALIRYEFKYEADSTEAALDEERQVHILSLHANYHPTRDWIIGFHYATKIAQESSHGASDLYNANLAALRVTYDLTKRWDVGLNSSVLFDAEFRSVQFGFGPEVGWTFKNNMRIAAGFNFFGFKDKDLAGQDYTNPGFFLSFRFKFDETLFGRGNNSKEGGKE
jgi:uncharacterized repeat protein (TIGR01451 family)